MSAPPLSAAVAERVGGRVSTGSRGGPRKIWSELKWIEKTIHRSVPTLSPNHPNGSALYQGTTFSRAETRCRKGEGFRGCVRTVPPRGSRKISHFTQDSGVNPLGETRAKVPGCRSLSCARQTIGARCSMSPAEQAEAGSAGEQLAKEYSAGNSSRRWGSGRSCRPPGLTGHIGAIDFLMPKKTHLRCGHGARSRPQAVLELLRGAIAER